MIYSAETNSFYNAAIHGDNIPADGVDESLWKSAFAQLTDGMVAGKTLTSDEEGKPILIDPPAATPNQIIMGKITALEESVTARRIREAVLGVDGGWLKALNDQIAALRVNLK
jgi:hypothetical protein